MDSILTSVKKHIGIEESYEHFDPDIIDAINTALSILTQLGVGDSRGFSISDKTSTWVEFMGDSPNLNMVKTYVYLKVRLIFDPPQSSVVRDAITKNLEELEFRINVEADKWGKEEIQNG